MFLQSVTARLFLLIGLPMVAIVAFVGASLWMFSLLNQGMGRVYDDRVVPLTQLKEITDSYTDTVNAVNKADNGLMIPNEAAQLMEESQQNIKTQWRDYRSGRLNAQELELVKQADALFGGADEVIEEARVILLDMGDSLSWDEDGDTLVTEYNGDLYDYVDPITDKIAELSEIQLKIAREERTAAQSLYDTSFLAGLMVSALTLFLVAGVGWFVGRSINIPLQNLSTGIYRVEQDKDLTKTLKQERSDEIGQVASSFNLMLGEFSETMKSVSTTSESVRVASDELAEIVGENKKDVDEQSRQTEEVSEASKQMVSAIQQVSGNAKKANLAAGDANQAVSTSRVVVETTLESVKRLEVQVSEASDIIERVRRDSDAISSVLDVIRGISEQTNLLALNAAIEAARAGDQGRGFAVVADEVRALAVRTQDSTQEIQSMIDLLHDGISSAVKTIEDGRKEMETTVLQADKTSESLGVISNAVGQITQMNEEIDAATSEQNLMSENISENIASMASAGRRSQAQIERLNVASQELQSTSESMAKRVNQFSFD